MEHSFEKDVSTAFPFKRLRVDVLGSHMTYVDSYTGVETDIGSSNNATTALFLHGNPASAYVWRNIIPHVSDMLRCVAPDLIGMGESGKPNISYRFVDHVRYLEQFITSVIPEGKIILVMHDWGSALGFNWARNHESRLAGLVFQEFVRPFPTWNDMVADGDIKKFFLAFRHPEQGRDLIVEKNAFIENALPADVMRPLSNVELDHYRKPFLSKSSREPLVRWPNEIPIEGKPDDVYSIAETYHAWLLDNELPKLLFWGIPGRIVSEEQAAWYIANLKNVTGVCVGSALHFLEEDHPRKMGIELANWLRALTSKYEF